MADLKGDGRADIAASNFDDASVNVLLGNGDGCPDLVTVGDHDTSIGILLSTGNGDFRPAWAATDVTPRNTPLLSDLNRDGFIDRIVLDRPGKILLRAGLSIAGNSLAPPGHPQPRPPGPGISRCCAPGADTQSDELALLDSFCKQ